MRREVSFGRKAVSAVACAALVTGLVPAAAFAQVLAPASLGGEGAGVGPVIARVADAVAMAASSADLRAADDEVDFIVVFEDGDLVYSGRGVVPVVSEIRSFPLADDYPVETVLVAGTDYDAGSAKYAVDSEADLNSAARLDADGKPLGAGSYIVTFAGLGAYAGQSIVGGFSVEKADFSYAEEQGKLTVTLYDGNVQTNSFTYTGKPIAPRVVVAYDGEELPDSEYTVEADPAEYVTLDDDDTRTLSVRASDDGDFTGYVEASYRITPAVAKLAVESGSYSSKLITLEEGDDVAVLLHVTVDGTTFTEEVVDSDSVTAVSSNPAVATATWENEVLTVHGVSEGSAKVTVSASISENDNFSNTELDPIELDVKVGTTSYSIDYDVDPGSVPADAPTWYTKDDAVVLPDATCPTRTFDGWYDADDDVKVTGIPQGSTGNRTFKAQWLLNLGRIDPLGYDNADGDAFVYTGQPIVPDITVFDAEEGDVPAEALDIVVTGNEGVTTSALITVSAKEGSGYHGQLTQTFSIVNANTANLVDMIVMWRDILTRPTVSVDGRDVVNGASWVTQADYDAFEQAINGARAVSLKSPVSEAEVDAALEAGTQAAEDFEAAISVANVDFTELDEALADGSRATEITPSADGSDLRDGEEWALPEQIDACLAALEAGEALVQSSDSATQEAVDAAVAAITAANKALHVQVTQVDKTQARAALASATKLDDEVWESEDGLDVPDGLKWAPHEARTNYENAINLLQDVVDNDESTQKEVDNALVTFNEADKALVVRTASVSVASLAALVKRADALLDGVQEAESSFYAELDEGVKWVTPAEMWELVEPLDNAREVVDMDVSERGQGTVNEAYEALLPAVNAFENRVKVVGGKVVSPDPVTKESATAWDRLEGAIGLDTMASIVRAGDFPKEGSVVLATFDGYWDALTAAGMAGFLDAPVLMTDPNALSPQTAEVLAELAPNYIFVVGGESAMPERTVDAACEAAGGATSFRAAGATATGTAVDVYSMMADQRLGAWSHTAFVCTNDGYWDALAAAPIAYAAHMPIFLTEGRDGGLSNEALEAMAAGGVKRVYIVGGESAVGPGITAQLAGRGITVAGRLAGERAVQTSEAVAAYGLSLGMTANKLGVATTAGYWDALSGSALCGRNESVLVLVDDAGSSSISGFVKSHSSEIVQAYVFGGNAAVGDDALAALKGVTPAP